MRPALAVPIGLLVGAAMAVIHLALLSRSLDRVALLSAAQARAAVPCAGQFPCQVHFWQQPAVSERLGFRQCIFCVFQALPPAFQ